MIKSLLEKPRIAKADSAQLMLLFSMLLVISPHMLRIPAWLSLFCLSLIVWRLFFEAGKSRLPNQLIKILLIVIAIAGILISYQTIVGRNAGSAVLLLMFCLKLTEFKTTRDAFVIVFLGFFIVITGFLFSQSIPIAIYMFMVLISLTTTLIAFQHPATLFSQKQHLRLAARMLVFSIPLAVVLFLLFPRTSGPLWGLPEDAYNAKTGLSDQMSPGRISSLSESNEIAFRVKFDNKLPDPALRYWRGPVLWDFDGSRWTSPDDQRHIAVNYSIDNINEPLSYTITLQPHNNYWLFTLDIPVNNPAESYFTSELLLLSKKPVREVTRYSITSHTNYQLANYKSLPLTRYLQLPVSRSPKTRSLIDQWRSQQLSDQQVVQKALNYFSTKEFYYSRQPPLLFDDPVDEFLFQTRKGFCEHYASAFTVMMRMAGIPARVVTGYFGGEINPLGDYMIVRQSDAHAWSEVYLEGSGWLRIDPTSAIPPDHIENTNDIIRMKPQSDQAINILKDTSWLYRSYKNINSLVDSINNSWTHWVIGYNNKKQISLFDAFGVPEITWKGLTTIMIGLLSVLLSLFGYYLLINKPKIDPVNKIYARFCKKMKKLGFTKQASETASDFAERILEQEPQLKVSVMKITTTYNSFHYGKYQTKAMLQTLADNINALKI